MNAYRDQERVERRSHDDRLEQLELRQRQTRRAGADLAGTTPTTLFHEFGHALHGLTSNVTYPTLSGTNVARDYVEFPSQLLEHWLSTPEVLQKFALHYQTGKPIPQALVDKIKKAATFNQGFATVEYLASALVDMKLHLAGDQKIDPDAVRARNARGARHAARDRDAPPHAAVRPRLLGRRLFGRLLQLSLVGRADGRCLRGVHRGRGRTIKPSPKRLRKNIFSVGNTIDPADGYPRFPRPRSRTSRR